MLMEDSKTGILAETRCICGEGVRGYLALALGSVMAKRHSSVVVQLLNDTKEPKGWERWHVGVERGVTCEHFSSIGDKFTEETLGMPRTMNRERDARSTQAHNYVFGELGWQDCFRFS